MVGYSIVNRSRDSVQLENISKILFRFDNIRSFRGIFENDTLTVEPYGFSIIKAHFCE